MLHKVQKRLRRAHRTRTVIEGTASRPRLSVFRSNTHISVQAIDDVRGVTLASAHDGQVAGSKSEKASQVGKQIAEALLAQGVKTCVFDRGGYLYHGRVKALAESARQAGVEF